MNSIAGSCVADSPAGAESTARAIFFLMGPTASGKSDAAAALAEQFDFEIVSVDAALVYRGMDVGTAKPPEALRRRYPHYLVDIRDPDQGFSAAEFCREAGRAILEIQERRRVPLLVGGTMFYFNALERGLGPQPAADAALRDRLARRGAQMGWPALHQELADLDPQRAAAISPTDGQRILRALEICHAGAGPVRPRPEHGPYTGSAITKIALAPTDRDWLHQRIRTRFLDMLERGLVDEVKALLETGISLDSQALRAVGYRQVGEYVEGKLSYNDMVLRGIASTRQLAKRQLTWLRNQRGVTWIDCATVNAQDVLAVYIRNKFEAGGLRRRA